MNIVKLFFLNAHNSISTYISLIQNVLNGIEGNLTQIAILYLTKFIYFQINAIDFEDVLKYDDKCFIRPGSIIRKTFFDEIIRPSGSNLRCH